MTITFQDAFESNLICNTIRTKEQKIITYEAIEKVVGRFFDSFGFSKSNHLIIESTAIDTLDHFKYDSIQDIVLFFKMARQGKFGTTSRMPDSNLIFGEWFPRYQEMKAEERERRHRREKDKLKENTTSIENVEKAYAKMKNAKSEIYKRIDEGIKGFNRVQLENLIAIIQKSDRPNKDIELKYLKKQRRVIK